MKLDRRDFLKMVGTVVPAWGLMPIASAQSAPYSGPVLIRIHASGGLDASSWTDPRETDPAMNDYARAGTPAVGAGKLRVAPMADNGPFFTSYGKYMLVINGINMETNSHDDGTRTGAVGRLDPGYPNISEMFAAQYGDKLPMSWLNSGGFSMSAGLRAPTPVPDANTFRALMTPNANGTNVFIKQADLDKVNAARGARMAALQAGGTLLPREQFIASQFAASAQSRAMLQRVATFIPATLDAGFTQANVALIAAQAGICNTIQLSVGGFDAHSNITNTYNTNLKRLTDLMRYLMDKSAALGIGDRVILNVYTDFSRTPLINTGAGKDHYGGGSWQIVMRANPDWGGGKVVGATGPRHQPLKINPTTGAVDPVNGVMIRPRHFHAAMRKYLGITTSNPNFDLKVPASEMFDFFSPAVETPYPYL